ncbi:AraC family transcriptional regulator [Adhaeribacter aquaticus]|uniref:AraC family transcriptional regulator n=1 Tax=Adhaeribacter aquaticus TaxID=299567 RepID=UPI00042A4126|nr:AraC family transcriptional regulator [Adhaeribacter aquaticus]
MSKIIRNSFPDLAWLKDQVAHRFQTNEGWPNVILHVKSSGCYRPDIKGGLTLFMNRKGTSLCKVENQTQKIPEDCFFLSNPDQRYTLTIEPTAPAETFNIHFGQKFIAEVYQGLVLPDIALLDNPVAEQTSAINFYNKLYPKEAIVESLLHQLYQCSQENADNLQVEELLAQILGYLLKVHQQVNAQIAQMPAVKSATKQEAFRRLSLSVDYLNSFCDREVSLDELAGIACLSKFHYLRLFQNCFKQSPYQYLTQLRLEKAKRLLRKPDMPIGEVAEKVGFANFSSFCRAFYKKEKMSATDYRTHLS